MHFKMSSAVCFNLDQSKILLSGNGLTHEVEHNKSFTLSPLLTTKEAFVDTADQDQTAQNIQSDLYIHCPHFYSRL